jgi:DNA-binding LytR/AlgR family response regulator
MKNNKRVIEVYIWNNSNSSIVLANKFYSTINDAMNQLSNKRFIQCERSYIVNLDYVDQMLRSSFTLIDIDKTQIPISRSKLSLVKAKYHDYIS